MSWIGSVAGLITERKRELASDERSDKWTDDEVKAMLEKNSPPECFMLIKRVSLDDLRKIYPSSQDG